MFSMGRPRTLDPANLPPSPNPTTDQERERELIKEFQKRAKYLADTYKACKQASGGHQSFNESIETIKRSLKRTKRSSLPQKRVHPAIEVEITRRAKLLAKAEDRHVTQADVDAAASELMGSLSKLRGAPKNEFLRYHLAGLMALVQQFFGQPVLAQREKPGEYAPHFADGVSQIVPWFFEQVDPDVRLTTLVECAISIRAEYAGKKLDFLELFPTYRTFVDEDGELQAGPGVEVKAIERNIPLYSR